MKRILVTGAAGRLGRAVCSVAVGRYDVVGFDLADPQVQGIQAVIGDVRDLDALQKAAKGCAAIVHTAALQMDHQVMLGPRGSRHGSV
jgi:nucleoside-diphosphate-sugar epimerase